jgi:hypothetical protein
LLGGVVGVVGVVAVVGEEAEVGAAEDGTAVNGAINTSTSAIFQHKELALSTSLPTTSP